VVGDTYSSPNVTFPVSRPRKGAQQGFLFVCLFIYLCVWMSANCETKVQPGQPHENKGTFSQTPGFYYVCCSTDGGLTWRQQEEEGLFVDVGMRSQ
jgi:hypothetical protein